MLRYHLAIAVALASASVTALPALAVPITYKAETIGSGVLDGQAFTDADVQVIATGNTVNVTHAGTFYTNLPVTGTVTVAGIGTDTFKFPIKAESNFGLAAAILSQGGGFILGTDAPGQFGNYELASTFGPVSGGQLDNLGHAWATAGGDFDLTAAGSVAFSSNAPEPASFLLLGSAVAGLAMGRRFVGRERQ